MLPENERTAINNLCVVGFLVSILGIVIAYFQIMSVKEITKYTQAKLHENMVAHSNLHMISDLSGKGAMINEIQGYLKEENINMSAIRMKDLKVFLVALQNQPRYKFISEKK